ncbi:EamA family transporter [Brevibacterium litoralis]|uniref:EamA family transporter n=1 Tax=Brevibacterium litoralis TaxID=3138935 RepID=UPI0032F03283
MPITHRLLAASVAIMWGVNFLAIDASLAQFPPYFLVAFRFALIAVPTLLFVPRPRVRWRWLIGYGIGFGTLQFLFLYWGMAIGMPAGLASLVLQTSAPFTVLLGATFLRERLSGPQVVGILVAVSGLAVVGAYRAEAAAFLPFLLTVAGAFGWAIGNICNRQARTTEPLRLTLWMSVVPPVPMLALSLAAEGPGAIAESFTSLGSTTGVLSLVGLAYTVLVGTVVASGIWSWLMARHPAGAVAPFSLLVPVVGITAAWVVLGQAAAGQELLGGLLLVCGVFLGSLSRFPWTPVRAPEPAPAPVPVPATAPVPAPEAPPESTSDAGSPDPDDGDPHQPVVPVPR